METGGRRRERATWGPVSRGAGSKACWRHVWRARGKEGVYSPRPAARRGRRSIGAPWLRRSGAPRKQHASQRGGPTLTLGARYASALRFSFKAACRLRTGWALPPPSESGTTAALVSPSPSLGPRLPTRAIRLIPLRSCRPTSHRRRGTRTYTPAGCTGGHGY